MASYLGEGALLLLIYSHESWDDHGILKYMAHLGNYVYLYNCGSVLNERLLWGAGVRRAKTVLVPCFSLYH